MTKTTARRWLATIGVLVVATAMTLGAIWVYNQADMSTDMTMLLSLATGCLIGWPAGQALVLIWMDTWR